MRSMLEVYIKDAKNFQKFGQYDLAIEALEQAQKIDSQHQFEVEIQKLLSFNYRKLGNFSLALLHINNAINLALSPKTAEKADEEYAVCLMNKGVIYEELGDSATAIKCYLPALKILIDLFNSTPEKFGIIINAFLTIGLLYYNQKQYSKTKDYFEQALPYFGVGKESDRRYISIIEILREIKNRELIEEHSEQE